MKRKENSYRRYQTHQTGHVNRQLYVREDTNADLNTERTAFVTNMIQLPLLITEQVNNHLV